MIEQMLTQAKELVAKGEERLAAQEARVVEHRRKCREGRESWRLLIIMRDTQSLQIGHVSLLERELGAANKA